MYQNGVSHKTERSDIDGVRRLLKWLSYMPKHRGASLPITLSEDPVDRDVEFSPQEGETYDPR